jgi:hypothetical protein
MATKTLTLTVTATKLAVAKLVINKDIYNQHTDHVEMLVSDKLKDITGAYFSETLVRNLIKFEIPGLSCTVENNQYEINAEEEYSVIIVYIFKMENGLLQWDEN